MNCRGFSLVELMVVLVLVGIMLTIATLNWQEMKVKSDTETQAKTLYADLASIRLQALYMKRPRSVRIDNQVFKVYSSADTTGSPIETKKLTYKTVWNSSSILTTGKMVFDAQGLLNGNERSICILPTGDTIDVSTANVDSLVISQARINLGKRTGGDCNSDNIEQK